MLTGKTIPGRTGSTSLSGPTILSGSARAAIAATAVALVLTGCTRLRDRQGYVADEDMVEAIAAGVDNRASVEQTLGRPTFQSRWDDNTWYYVSRNTAQLAFLPPATTEQKMLVVQFDDAGNVTAVDRRDGLDQIASFDPEDDKTPVFGRDSSLFQEIFGNIGRVSSVPAGPPGP